MTNPIPNIDPKCADLNCDARVPLDAIPSMWHRHIGFHPIVLCAFFSGTGRVTEDELDTLSTFLCPSHQERFRDHRARSHRAVAAHARRRARRITNTKTSN